MKGVWILILAIVISCDCGNVTEFPVDFLWGTASSAFQIEGAWNESGKGESILDRFTHTRPDQIADHSNADVACDSYHRYKEDVALMKSIDAKVYRFSISWPRIMPDGYLSSLNQEGIRHYNELIDELLANDIQPFATMFHFDLPQTLQDIGGWTNEFIVPLFEDYARVLFENYGDRVRLWITFNEPVTFCAISYSRGLFVPKVKPQGTAEYMCAHNYLKAHARVWHLYDDEFRQRQGGKVGTAQNVVWMEPENPKNANDVQAVEISFQFTVGLYAHPIYSEKGDYPLLVKETVRNRSIAEGLRRSRLPEFSEYWIEYIKGTYDFFGLNHYTTTLVTLGNPSFVLDSKDTGVSSHQDDSWPKSSNATFNKSVPCGFNKLLRSLKNRYDDPEIYVTENGWPDDGRLNDTERIEYHHDYLEAMMDAMVNGGANVKGYTVWSLLDSFEFTAGYTMKFGLFNVDFNSVNRTRTAKLSSQYMKRVFHSNKIQPLDGWV